MLKVSEHQPNEEDKYTNVLRSFNESVTNSHPHMLNTMLNWVPEALRFTAAACRDPTHQAPSTRFADGVDAKLVHHRIGARTIHRVTPFRGNRPTTHNATQI